MINEDHHDINYYREQLQAKSQMLEMTTAFLESARIALEEKNKLLEEINKHNLESIDFAKKIQLSLLPNVEPFKNVCGGMTYLVKQLIGIGGDSVFVKEWGNETIFGLFDCTGHGIPGALLSVSSTLSISEIIGVSDSPNPSTIASTLNGRLFTAFNNSGMSLAHLEGLIFRMQNGSGTINYVSAKGKGFIISNGQLTELQQDKISIGEIKGAQFTEFELTVAKNDLLVFYSDGLVDQFGGPRSKKYSKSRLHNFVYENSELSVEELKDAILKEHRDWTGHTQQTDDISLMIFKF